MYLAISGSHRAFLGISLSLIVVLSLSLGIGWRWHFKQLENRCAVIAMAAAAEAKRKNQARPLNAPPATTEIERSSLPLAEERLQRQEETEASGPTPAESDALRLSDLESLFPKEKSGSKMIRN